MDQINNLLIPHGFKWNEGFVLIEDQFCDYSIEGMPIPGTELCPWISSEITREGSFVWYNQSDPPCHMKTKHEQFLDYMAHFERRDDTELVLAINRQIGNQGWSSARGSYLESIRHQFEQRNIDFSAVVNEKSISYRNHVFLFNKKLWLLSSLCTKNKDPLLIKL